MSSLLSIGAGALLANQQTLQTAGNNVANVNTPGYSRQSVLLRNVEGQFSGGGYYGNGVTAETVLRSHSEFLTRQATLAGSIAAADTRRLEQLRQLEALLPGGPTGLGAAVGNLLDSFSNVASAPTDLPARTVVLARADETAARFRSTADGLASLQRDVQGELDATVASINSLAQRIARANRDIADATGRGHTPNDLLDQRDQLIRDLNKLVQTTSIAADDGSVSLFLAASQPLVLGSSAASVSITGDEFGDPAKSKLAITRGTQTVVMEEASLGGGVVSGLLRFQNTDLVEAANLLGRMALGLGTTMNDQHRLGVDLAGSPGGDMFALGSVPDGLAASGNTGGATLQVTVQAGGAPAFAASDYEVVFTGATTGSIKRLSDGQVTAFGAVPVQIDGLSLQLTGAPAANDRFLVTPFRQAAGGIDTSFSSPRALAMASPITASAGAANGGTLTLQSLLAQQADPNLTQTVTLTFTGAGNFDVVGVGTGNPVGVAFIPGQAISYNGWALTLKGTPQIGDSYTVQVNAYPHVSAGNAEAMLALRDLALFDGAPTTEGFAAVMTQIGVLVQSADSADSVSRALATSATADEAAVSGVNLDEEAAKLLQFQQAYQASAKMLQVSQTIWDALINAVVR